MTEPYAKAQPELVQRMIDEGHEIGNHSVTHPSEGLPSQSLEQQKNEVMENHQYIKDNFGYDMHLFRFPAGKFSDQSLAVVNNCNYKSVFWSFAYKDYDVNNQPGESEALQKLKDRMHPGAIYLYMRSLPPIQPFLEDLLMRRRRQATKWWHFSKAEKGISGEYMD